MMNNKEPRSRLVCLSQFFGYILYDSFLDFIKFTGIVRVNHSIDILAEKSGW
jgi:hypothetical protein